MHIAHFTFDCCIWPHKKHRTQSHAYKCITFDFMLHFTRMKLSRHHRQTRQLHYITCTQFANTENIEWIFACVCVCLCSGMHCACIYFVWAKIYRIDIGLEPLHYIRSDHKFVCMSIWFNSRKPAYTQTHNLWMMPLE